MVLKSILSVTAACGSVIDKGVHFPGKCPYRTLKIDLKSVIQCRIHAILRRTGADRQCVRIGVVTTDFQLAGVSWQRPALGRTGLISDIRVIRGQNKSHVEPHDVTDDPVVRYSPDHALF